MKKAFRCAAALVLTGLLLSCLPALKSAGKEAERREKLTVVWMQEGDTDTAAWLKKAAAAYEKKTGGRVYLRYAAAEERQAARDGPDVVMGEDGITVARRGYALLVPDDTAPMPTPAPTPALFIRPTQAPALATPPPQKVQMPKVIALPEAFSGLVEGGYVTGSPLNDLSSGKAGGALLTPVQAARVQGGYGVIAEKRFFLPVAARALTAEGQNFLAFLRSGEGQSLLTTQRMFSWDENLHLYSPDTPLLYQMENCR